MATTQIRSLEIASLSELPGASFIPLRYRPGNLGTWSGHLTFANDLIAEIRPALLVELGTHWGESYFTFCQSVFQNGVDCLCYSVDHWRGEQHAGHYGEEVFDDVQRFNDSHYRGFSYLLRTGFDNALEQFSDDSIDLLHIDGLHTYEAVSHDFQTWLPKVKPGGIILLHDIAVRHADFGVWRLWDELKAEFPRHFTFFHWWGLGVLQKPGGPGAASGFLDLLFHARPEMAERIRRHYLMQTAFLESTQVSSPQQPASADQELSKLRDELAESERRAAESCAQAERLEELLATTSVRLRQEMQREAGNLREMLAAAEERLKDDSRKLEGKVALESELQGTRADLHAERALVASMLNSKSWLVTRPLRNLMRALKLGQ